MFEKTLETGSIQSIHNEMVPTSLPFTILILSSWHGVTERRIVSELQSIFALQFPFTEIETRMGKLYKKALVKCLVFIQARNVVEPGFTKCVHKALPVSQDYFYNSKINILPSLLKQ